MIINEKVIEKIFNLKLKLKGKDKEELSRYNKLIPMYDIYSRNIYPINKFDLFDKLIKCHYRFINSELFDLLTKYYQKELDKKSKNINQIKTILNIIDNYNLDILYETSYKTLYEYTTDLGLSVSICIRKSFHPFISHLCPYYSKNEIIKLGQNLKLFDEIEIERLLDKKYHYKICKSLVKNDISYKEIKNHTQYIIKKGLISYITFYSFFGSFLYNQNLRKEYTINTFLYEGLYKLVDLIKNSPEMEKNHFLYRFVCNDDNISSLKIGDYYEDNAFISTTRDPFYSPGLNGNFGLILIKININVDVINAGLLIENFSLFPREEEYLLPPNCKLRLVSKDDKFKYYHINNKFEKLIKKKYEFDFIEYSKVNKLNIINNHNIITNLKEYEIDSYNSTRLIMLKKFLSKSNQIIIHMNNEKYLFFCIFFDGSLNSSYERLYYNKINDGVLLSIYENGYPYLNIECGKELIINYVNQYYFYNEHKTELDERHLNIILEIGRLFNYKEAKIYYNYRNFSEFSKDDENYIFYYTHFYNHSLYNLAKYNKKYLDYNFVKNNIGWYLLKDILNSKLSNEIKKKFNLKVSTIGDGLIYIIENEFFNYKKYIEMVELNKDYYLIYEIFEKLNNENRITNFKSELLYNEDYGNEYKTIFRQPIRRY
jgi:hypothetical protein